MGKLVKGLKPIQIEGGLLFHEGTFLAFFGDARTDLTALETQFKNVHFQFVNQVHGDQIIEASNEVQKADGHWTSLTNHGLVIRTADCLPILIWDSVRFKVMALHAGWRGVAQQIAKKGIALFIQQGSKPSDIRVLIGPHIGMDSFEVDEPVWLELKDSILNDQEPIFNFANHFTSSKYKVNLELLIRNQLQASGVHSSQIRGVSIDTFTQKNWNSFRRDREQSGRNLSFIVRIEPNL